MNKIAHLFLIALAIAIMTVLAAIAWSQPQSGSIKVTVLTISNDPVRGASIRLLGIKQGAIAKPNGTGQIRNIRPGTYTISVAFVGFEIDTIKNINVVSDSITSATVHLRERHTTEPIIIQPKVANDITTSNRVSLLQILARIGNDTARMGSNPRGARGTENQVRISDTATTPSTTSTTSKIDSVMAIKKRIHIQKKQVMQSAPTITYEVSVKGTRAADSVANFSDPIGNQFHSAPISKFAISEIWIPPIDTTSRVYRVYYKK